MEFQSIHNGLICPSVTISNVTEVTNSIDVLDEVCLEKSLHSKFNVSYKIVLSSFDFSSYEASTDGILQTTWPNIFQICCNHSIKGRNERG